MLASTNTIGSKIDFLSRPDDFKKALSSASKIKFAGTVDKYKLKFDCRRLSLTGWDPFPNYKGITLDRRRATARQISYFESVCGLNVMLARRVLSVATRGPLRSSVPVSMRSFSDEPLTIPTDREQQGGRRKEELDAMERGKLDSITEICFSAS